MLTSCKKQSRKNPSISLFYEWITFIIGTYQDGLKLLPSRIECPFWGWNGPLETKRWNSDRSDGIGRAGSRPLSSRTAPPSAIIGRFSMLTLQYRNRVGCLFGCIYSRNENIKNFKNNDSLISLLATSDKFIIPCLFMALILSNEFNDSYFFKH